MSRRCGVHEGGKHRPGRVVVCWNGWAGDVVFSMRAVRCGAGSFTVLVFCCNLQGRWRGRILYLCSVWEEKTRSGGGCCFVHCFYDCYKSRCG